MILAVLLASRLATAAPTDAAKALFMEGSAAYERGNYLVAIEKFDAAWQLDPKPALLYNKAGAQERAGRWADARDTLQRYLDVCSPDEVDAIRARVKNLDVQIALYGPEVVLSIETLSRPEATPVPTPALAPLAGGTQPAQAAPTVEAQATVTRRSWAAPVALGAVGVAGLGAGAAFGAMALDARGDAARACAGTLCTPGAAAALKRDETWSLAADIAFGVGAAGAIGSVITLFTGHPQAVAIGPGWISLQGSFR